MYEKLKIEELDFLNKLSIFLILIFLDFMSEIFIIYIFKENLFIILFDLIIIFLKFYYLLKIENLDIKLGFKVKLKEFIIVTLATILMYIIITLLMITYVIETKNQSMIIDLLNQKTTYLILKIVLVVPLTEEILFRAYFSNLFKNKKIGIIFSAILFSISHIALDFKSFIIYFIIGICFSLIYFFTNLKLVVYSHILYNLIAIIHLKNGII